MNNTRKVRVWDLPLRLFHWLLLASVATAFIAIWNNQMDLHAWAGYSVLTLLIFRLIWGFVGSTHARFTSFIKGPKTILNYLKKPHDRNETGHNPLGALSVIGMLSFLLIQTITGIFNHSDDFFFYGPLYKFISGAVADQLGGLHKLMELPILALIGLHLAAIIFYRVIKKDKLVKTMLTGNKDIDATTPTAEAKGGSVWLGLVVLIIAIGLMALILTR